MGLVFSLVGLLRVVAANLLVGVVESWHGGLAPGAFGLVLAHWCAGPWISVLLRAPKADTDLLVWGFWYEGSWL